MPSTSRSTSAIPDKLVEIIAALEPTFGAINLEDIKAPECFEVEAKLRARMGIPVFHDDQHGTAIIVAAAILNGLHLVGKELGQIRLVTSRRRRRRARLPRSAAGARPRRASTCSWSTSKAWSMPAAATLMDPYKARFAQPTAKRTLARGDRGRGRVPRPVGAQRAQPRRWSRAWPSRPLILALANPVPEIDPEVARAARPDAIIATGRSDYPNQVNNVIGFPVHLPRRPGCGRDRRSTRR